MKSNVNKNKKGLMRLSFLLIGTGVLAAAILGAGAYTQTEKQTESSEHDLVMLDRLIEARRANLLLQCLSRGNDAQARQLLTITLSDDLQQAKALSQTTTPAVAAQAVHTIALLERDKRAHPELYAALKTPVQTPRSVELARHEIKH